MDELKVFYVKTVLDRDKKCTGCRKDLKKGDIAYREIRPIFHTFKPGVFCSTGCLFKRRILQNPEFKILLKKFKPSKQI